MLVYHYDPDTGAFLNTSSAADEDPMEPGHWLIPAHATELLPPSVSDPKKQHAVFADGGWHIEDKPVPPALQKNMDEAPVEGMWPRISIKEALKGGIT
jgi:hypothetical protein